LKIKLEKQLNMKNNIVLCTLATFALLATMSVSAQAQTPTQYEDSDALVEYFLGKEDLPDGGLGPSPSIRTLRGYYTVSGFHQKPYDKYNPVWSGVASAIIPGFGQAICGKPLRGVLFLAGTVGPAVAAVLTYQKPVTNDYGMVEHNVAHTAALIGVSAAMWIWNVLDAAEVAILLNKYNRDTLQERGVSLSLNPNFSVTPSADGAIAPTAGIALTLNF